jgi:hypothetical protein
MPTINASYSQDNNRVPITTDGITISKTIAFAGDDATVATPIFSITGAVEVRALYGVVTTALGANHTAAHWRLNDQTATDVVLTAAAGTTLNGASVGAMVLKVGKAAAALTYKTADAATILEPTTLETMVFSPFILSQKTGGIETDIEYVYTTDDDSTSGAIKFYIRWLPLSSDGAITAL